MTIYCSVEPLVGRQFSFKITELVRFITAETVLLRHNHVGTAALGCPGRTTLAQAVGKRPVELRSTRQPRAAVPTWFVTFTAECLTEFPAPRILNESYAKALRADRPLLLYADAGEWVAQ